MRTIGLLGGMSWESTAVYYRRLNESVRDRLGGLHSAKVIMHSVDFEKHRRSCRRSTRGIRPAPSSPCWRAILRPPAPIAS